MLVLIDAMFEPLPDSNDAVSVRAATLDTLIEVGVSIFASIQQHTYHHTLTSQLLSHPRERDDTFEDEFLLMFPCFAAPLEVLDLLCGRFDAHPYDAPAADVAVNATVRARVLQVCFVVYSNERIYFSFVFIVVVVYFALASSKQTKNILKINNFLTIIIII